MPHLGSDFGSCIADTEFNGGLFWNREKPCAAICIRSDILPLVTLIPLKRDMLILTTRYEERARKDAKTRLHLQSSRG